MNHKKEIIRNLLCMFLWTVVFIRVFIFGANSIIPFALSYVSLMAAFTYDIFVKKGDIREW